jgi:triacylglycerol lipase
MQKPIPEPLPKFVYPPIPSEIHHYFQDASDHPFRPEATGLELVNAWWLAEAALLAYAGPKLAGDAFKQAGLTVAAGQPFRGPSTECYVAHCERFVIVAFRGTQVFRIGAHGNLAALLDALRDLVTDSKFCLEEAQGGGSVHSGFKSALDEVWTPLVACLQQLAKERPNRTIWFTGHSLGAALATLAAVRFPGVRGLYTFGSPRVGDADFAQRLKVPAFRFVNNNDLVTRVPPLGRYKSHMGQGKYKHVEVEKYIDSNGRLGSERSLMDGLGGVAKNFGEGLLEVGQHDWLSRQPLDSFNDHGPLFYALHLWNNYERS